MKNLNIVIRTTGHAKTILFSLLCTLLFSVHADAQGNLLIFPKRVVFDGKDKFQSINLTNTGNDTAKYNISFVQIRMNDNGSFEMISTADSGQLFASDFVRFFPRNVILGPNESQVVKVQLVKSNQLIPGEYRSHLYFRAEPLREPLGEKELTQDTTISVRLTAIFGITIPVIIRSGEPDTQVNLSNLSFEKFNDSIPVVNIQFNREGNMSVYGDITVNYISPKGKVTCVGKIQGFAVYTPGSLRKCKMELKNLEGVDYNNGKLQIIYSAQSSSRNATLAEKELSL